MFLGLYQRQMITGRLKLEDKRATYCQLLLIHQSVFMFEFSFHSCVQNQKLIIYLMFFFFFGLGERYLYRENDKCQLCFKYEWDAFLLMDVENKMYMIQQCKVFYVAKKIMYNFLYNTSSGILIRFQVNKVFELG